MMCRVIVVLLFNGVEILRNEVIFIIYTRAYIRTYLVLLSIIFYKVKF